ncbi:MAG: hypothetical protein GWP08_19250 [Nitrospiraceae bacterium]|nr:hypothetical protein [Nitrospiraceae bacterium]
MVFDVKSALRKLLSPVYVCVARMPFARSLVAREVGRLASEPFSAAIIDAFIHGECGSAYGLSAKDKMDLVARFRNSNANIQSGTSPLVHTILAQEILSIPADVPGDVIECGVWKGASSASLSLVCGLAGRRLLVCDSFEGLPDDGEQLHYGLHTKRYGRYQQGMFAGGLEEVRENIRRCGNLDACTFISGFFSESLTALSDPIAFAFLDVDLVSSTRDCLRHIWPLLVEHGALYSDDAGDLAVVGVFFDAAWWQENLGCAAPGYVGSGCGIPLNPAASSIGYTRKIGRFDPTGWVKDPYLHHA